MILDYLVKLKFYKFLEGLTLIHVILIIIFK